MPERRSDGGASALLVSLVALVTGSFGCLWTCQMWLVVGTLMGQPLLDLLAMAGNGYFSSPDLWRSPLA